MTREFLGTGWSFPVRLTAKGGLSLSAGEQDIREAIWIVLATAKGERLMRPDFGCGIHDYVFAPNNAGTRARIADQVRYALLTFEPRIDVLDVRVETFAQESNKLLIRVDYSVRSTNKIGNIVYPFFLIEGGE